MTYLLAFAWMTGLEFAPRLTSQEAAALIMLAASLLVFRTFRERYLLVWILGWLVFLVSRWPAAGMLPDLAPQYCTALGETGFVLSVCIFSAAALVYCHARRSLLPLLLAGGVAVAFTAVRAFVYPADPTLRIIMEVLYRTIAFAGALRMLSALRGRLRFGSFLLVVTLMARHLEWSRLPRHSAGIDLLLDIFLGLSMLMMVLDHYRDRTRRLSAISSLTTVIARAQHSSVMLKAALNELLDLTGATSGWFSLLDKNRLTVVQHRGLSDQYLEHCRILTLDEYLEKLLHSGRPTVSKTAAFHASLRGYLRAEGFDHVLTVPIRGKKTILGTLSLARKRSRTYSPEELNFLTTSANQIGIAAENLRLREMIVRSQRQWINTFDSIDDAILVHDSNHRIIKVNRALVKKVKSRPADIVQKTCEEVLPKHTEWQGCPYCGRQNGSLLEYVDPCFGGFSLVSTSSYLEHGQGRRGTIHVIRDTSARRAAEEQYRQLFEQAQEGVFVATPEGRLLDCNDAFVRMLGYSSRDELMTLNRQREMYALEQQHEALQREIESRNFVRNFEVTLRRKDGSSLSALESSFATRDAAGKIERYQGFLLDMTEKKRAEDEIRRRNRELNALNAMATIATQSFDLDEILNLTLRQVVGLFSADTGSIYLADRDAKVLRRRAGWGHRSEGRAKWGELRLPDGFGDLILRSRTEVITPEYLPHLPAVIGEFVRADGLRSWIWVILWSKDRPVGVLGVGSRDAREFASSDENLLVAIGRQLATTIEKVHLYEETCRAYEDLRQTQEQLLQSEKMSAVGQLISGVAHELNNPLTAILGYAQLLEAEGLNERGKDFVGKLFKQAQRTHRVVQNLLSFARQRKPQKTLVDIRKVLEETLALRDYDFRVNNIRVEREMEENLPAVTADSHQLEQVFLNIINNAVDAMLEMGKSGSLLVRSFAADGQVWMEFHDSGPGIKDPKRIFDPFYTTKAVGKGTGLGLSICYGIIKEHGGEITASNRGEGGAVLQVRLPATGKAAAPEVTPAAPRRDLAIQGRILLVEEEPAVLEFARDVLAGAGVAVVTRAQSDEAKTLVQAESFDAVIMSGHLSPGTTIPELCSWLEQQAGGLEKRVLFTFAQIPEPEIRSFLEEKKIPFLVKPFEVSDLIAATKNLLRKTQAAAAGH